MAKRKRNYTENIDLDDIIEGVNSHLSTKKLPNYMQASVTPGYREKRAVVKALCGMSKYSPRTPRQGQMASSVRENDITIVAGRAGTGKTFVALAEALRLLADPSTDFHKIVLIKSVTTLRGEDIGFLPGNKDEKMEPFIASFLDNTNKLINEYVVRDLFTVLGAVKVEPLAYMRGRSFDNAIIIVDEAQNISVENLRTVLTRMGTDTKIIIIGDERQTDTKGNQQNGLTRVYEMFDGVPTVGTLRMGAEDIVRSAVVALIEDIFEKNGY